MPSPAWFLSQVQEQTTLTSLRTNMPPRLPKLDYCTVTATLAVWDSDPLVAVTAIT
jgi:hypothetical protein